MTSLEHANKYPGEHHILKDITLNVEQGEKIVIIGPSGSGKSTLARCMDQLEKVNDGSVVADNIDIIKPKAPIQKVRQKVAMAFQNFNLHAHKAIIGNLTLAPVKVMSVPKDEAVRTGTEYLEWVGSASKVSACPSRFFGGQQQRATIARALNTHPEIILFDKSTSALDPEVIQEVLDVVVDLSEQNIVMVCVTHKTGFTRQVTDRVTFMDQGQIIEQGVPEHFLTSTEDPRAKEFLNRIIHNR